MGENKQFTGVPQPGAVAARIDSSAGREIGPRPGTPSPPMSINPPVVDRVPMVAGITPELRSDLSKLTPSLARGVRDFVRRKE